MYAVNSLQLAEHRGPDELRRLIDDIEAGRVTLAPLPRDAYFLREFVDSFAREILGTEWRQVGVTAESSVLDLMALPDETKALALIKSVYGVDCSDIPGLNLWTVMRRCADNTGA